VLCPNFSHDAFLLVAQGRLIIDGVAAEAARGTDHQLDARFVGFIFLLGHGLLPSPRFES
jgi:hypothetical protein